MSFVRIGLAAAILALVIAGCSREPTRAPAPGATEGAAQQESWPAFVERFIESRMQAAPQFAVKSGSPPLPLVRKQMLGSAAGAL